MTKDNDLSSITKSFLRLVEFFPEQGCKDIQLKVIIQHDESKDIEKFGKLLNGNVEVKIDSIIGNSLLYVFVHIDDARYDRKFSFWEKVLVNIDHAVSISLDEILSPRQPANKLMLNDLLINKIKDLKPVDKNFSKFVIEKFIYLQKCIKEEYKNIKKKTDNDINLYDFRSHGYILHKFLRDTKDNSTIKKRDFYLFYSFVLHALMDWSKQNIWIFNILAINENLTPASVPAVKPQKIIQSASFINNKWTSFNILIVDDLMWRKWPPTMNIEEEKLSKDLKKALQISSSLSGRHWNCFRLKKKEEHFGNLVDFLKNFLRNDMKTIHCASINDELTIDLKLSDFSFILIDWLLDGTEDYTGFNLLRQMRSWIQKNTKMNDPIPALIILSRNSDPSTIQAAMDAGADGYIVKDQIGALPYVIGRSGPPLLKVHWERMEDLLHNSFPCLKSFPAFVPKALYFDKWKKTKSFEPSANGPTVEDNVSTGAEEAVIRKHGKWLKGIPKADLHVHFGTAVPINICYDLAVISVFRWLRKHEEPKGNDVLKGMLECASILKDILVKGVTNTKAGADFRDKLITSFRLVLRVNDIVTIKNAIALLKQKYEKKLSEDQIVCLIVAALGILFRKVTPESIKNRLQELDQIIKHIDKGKAEKNELLNFYLQDTEKIVDSLKRFYDLDGSKNSELIDSICVFACVTDLFNVRSEVRELSFDPLSSLLSPEKKLEPKAQGLLKYLGASDLVGSGFMQFVESLLLASYHIPIWAAKSNVWHQELRATTTGFLQEIESPELATKITLLGLYAGMMEAKKELGKDNKEIELSTSILMTAKRHKKQESIIKAVQLASDFVSKNQLNETRSQGKSSSQDGGYYDKNIVNFLPKVIGMDVAGVERGYLPEGLEPHFKEAFQKCLLLTIHAGEDESASSIWQAVYKLHALRIGHGLRLNHHEDLRRLFRDRQLCVELCPKSNQFTNGSNNDYVLGDYESYGVPVTINTDNPLLSWRLEKDQDYPLMDEFLILPNMVNEDCNINSLFILKLIFNGFKYSFLSPVEKARLIEIADREVFNILAKDFLDISIATVPKT